MAEIKHGTVVVTIADDLTPPAQAGKLSPQEVSRLARAPRAVGLACEQAADAMDKASGQFVPPAGVTPETLVAAAARADRIDQGIVDLEVVLHILKQANLLFDGDAWEQLRKVNDQIKAQSKHAPELAVMFKDTLAFFAKPSREKKPE